MKKIHVFVISLLCLSLIACTENNIHTFNEQASLPEQTILPFNPLSGRAVTSFISPSDSTMSTLYANEIAWKHLIQFPDSNTFPSEAESYLVTWKQQPDSVWFGALIPEHVLSVESIRFSGTEVKPTYTLYSGNPLKKTSVTHPEERIAWIMALKPAVSP